MRGGILLDMTLALTLTPAEEARLCARAAAAGVDVDTFARQVLVGEPDTRDAWEEFEKSLEPIRKAFAESGMTEDEVSDEYERVKHAERAARRGRPFEE